MPKLHQLIVATIGSPVGLKGEVNLSLRTDIPEDRLKEGNSLLLGNDLNSVKIRSSRVQHSKGRNRWIVSFDNINSREDVEKLRGVELLVEDSTTDEKDGVFYADLIGIDVAIPSNEVDFHIIGKVLNVIQNPAHDILEIKLNNQRKTLVPYVRQIVIDVNLQLNRLIIDPPAGLLDETYD